METIQDKHKAHQKGIINDGEAQLLQEFSDKDGTKYGVIIKDETPTGFFISKEDAIEYLNSRLGTNGEVTSNETQDMEAQEPEKDI